MSRSISSCRRWSFPRVLLGAVPVVALLLLSCASYGSSDAGDDLRCGEGTVRVDNVCVVDDGSDTSPEPTSDTGTSPDTGTSDAVDGGGAADGGATGDSDALTGGGDATDGGDVDEGGSSPNCGAPADGSGEQVTPSDFGVAAGEDLAPAIEGLEGGQTLVLEHQANYRLSDAGAVGVDDFTIAGNEATLESSSPTILKLIGDNWEFKCVYVDQRGDRADMQVWTGGADWDFHHVAWQGENSSSDHNPMWVASDPGSENYIRNVWFGDGLASSGENAIVAFGGRPTEAGHSDVNDGLTIVENSFFREFGGTYGLLSGDPTGYEGTFRFRSCYFENSYLSGPRIGHPERTSVIEDSVIVADDPSEVPPTKSGVVNSRGVWAWYGTVEVRDTHIYNSDYCAIATIAKSGHAPTVEVTGGHISGRICDGDGTVDVGDDVGSNPQTEPPESTVTSPEEAVTGGD